MYVCIFFVGKSVLRGIITLTVPQYSLARIKDAYVFFNSIHAFDGIEGHYGLSCLA